MDWSPILSIRLQLDSGSKLIGDCSSGKATDKVNLVGRCDEQKCVKMTAIVV